MAQMYCGNDLNFHGLLSGTHFLGTNYQCLQKGIGVGSNLPYDGNYSTPYAPVDGRKFYCGKDVAPPVGGGYFGMGSPSKCLAIGVGIGKAQRASMGPPAFMYFIRYILPYLLFFIIISGFFAILYFVKPKYIAKKDNKNKYIIDWDKFIPYYIIICLVTAIFIWWFWKRFVRRWI